MADSLHWGSCLAFVITSRQPVYFLAHALHALHYGIPNTLKLLYATYDPLGITRQRTDGTMNTKP